MDSPDLPPQINMLMTAENTKKHKEITKAIKLKKAIHIDYVDMKFNISTKFIDPLKIRHQTLIAYNREKKGVRQYHFDGIMKIEISKEDHVTSST